MASIVYTDASNRQHTVELSTRQPVVSIGRAADCTIRSNRKSVSRHHAEFRYNHGDFMIVDLNSSNGTWVIENGQRLQVNPSEQLAAEDEVWCGDFILYFYAEDQQGGFASPDAFEAPEYSEQNIYATEGAYDQGGGYGAQEFQQGDAWEGEVQELHEDDFEMIDSGAGDELGAELERVQREKASLEELASRQAFELEELQARVGQLEASVEASGPDLERVRELEESLAYERQQRQQAQAALDESREVAGRAGQMEVQLEEARATIQELHGALEASQTEAERAQGAARELEAARRRAEDLEVELDVARRERRRLEDEIAERDGAGAKVEELRGELARSERLVSEYEKRNIRLQREVNTERREAEELREAVQKQQARREEVEELMGALRERDARIEALEASSAEADDLRAEVQGLRERLQHAKRASTGSAEQRDKIEALTERVHALEAENEALNEAAGLAGDALSADECEAVAERLRALSRLVDAIERTDLGPLSTVDRIRLQSAIRETDPADTLTHVLGILDGE